MPLEPTTNPTEDLVPPSPVSSKSPTDEAILALAQGIANEHKTKLSGATAIEELEYVLEQLDVHEPADPEYELWQYLNGRSTDTKAAALALAQYVQGGGGASLTGNIAQLFIVNSEPSGYPYNGAPIAVRATAGINGHTVALGSFATMIAGADITLEFAPGGAWLVVPTSATLDPSTGPSFEFTKTALTITGNTVHIPDDIPEPLTVEYEVEGETFTDTALPYIGIFVEGGSK